ncbi:beta-ketoacyl synthase N-terminal-like domain-containing protein [Paenibacillus lentus]|uniref:beta-ketoacyl synthase N-terminal-like domain-containing protein n=1 Tax=Paenibacillus lentus TaxID=1338368 RepID=UPI0036575E83
MEYAITSMAGVFPGARNIDEYWENILNAEAASVTSLEKRWGIPREQYMDPQDTKKSLIYNDHGFCLPEEACSIGFMDSGRQVIVAKELLKEISKQFQDQSHDYDFSSTGLILGTSWSDVDYYNKDIDLLLGKPSSEIKGEIYTADNQIRAIAEALGIGGPCCAVDTACASSLYALDSGIGLIENGLADSAIIMGLNVSIPHFLYIGFSRLNALSPSHQILPFSKDASGILVGEGAGAILVEPMDRALKSGRNILAVIKSIGLSSDGEERSPFAPGYNGQRLALANAYRNLQDIKINYIEAHGTATKIGDETELKALIDFVDSTEHEGVIPLGSVKSLIGHGLAAAGIASIIKAVLIINKGMIPPHISVQPHALLDKSKLYLPIKAEKITDHGSGINIGVSSFGFGGANSHVVLSSFDKNEVLASKPSKQDGGANVLKEPLAILDYANDRNGDIEAALHTDLGKFTSFPFHRFQFMNGLNGLEKDRIIGDFLADSMIIDASGLKMGPNALKKIDPFQALVSHTIHVMLRRNEELKNTQDTGVVLCSNMSGLMSLRQFRKFYFMFNQDKITSLEHGEMSGLVDGEASFEEITSTIPAMLSGFPARHFNIKGFHQTMSGGETTFLQMLLLSPYWLNTHCKNLIIGAGHIIKSPADLVSYQRGIDELPPLREGFLTFVLKKLSDIEKGKEEILGYIPAIITGSHVNTFEEACKAADIDPLLVETIETCQLNVSSLSTNSKKPGEELFSGYMAEASGTVELIRMLQSKSKISCLQFMNKDEFVAAVFFVKEKAALEKTEHTIDLPTEINFTAPNTNIQSNPTQQSNPSSIMSIRPVREDVSFVYESMSSLVVKYLEQQKKILQSFPSFKAVDPKEPTAVLIEDPINNYFRELYRKENIVISDVYFHPTQNSCESMLIVDEGHYYFFDHELDHVPGFLIVEGILQLVKINVMHHLKLQNLDDFYFNSLTINFSKFCEKDASIKLKVKELKNNSNQEFVYEAEVIQGQSVICVAKVGIKHHNSRIVSARSHHKDTSLADQRYVHKQDMKNIVVEDIYIDAKTEKAICKSITPPTSHILYDGNGQAASVLYLLEVTRQFLAQMSHTFGVPFDMPQILLSMDIRVEKPLDKDTTVYIECEKQKTIKLNDSYLSNLKTTIKCNGLVIAETLYKAQAVSKDIYHELRWKK